MYNELSLRVGRERQRSRLKIAKAACRDGDVRVLDAVANEIVADGVLTSDEFAELRSCAEVRRREMAEEHQQRRKNEARRRVREDVARELKQWSEAMVRSAVEDEVERRLTEAGKSRERH
jgi:hypothetical protein